LIRCLLDKVTARRILEGLLKLAEGRDLTEVELFALDLYQHGRTEEVKLFVVPASELILQRLDSLSRYSAIIHLFRQSIEVAFPTRYFKRWARRLRDYGFTKEDAAVLALASFGTNEKADILGMNYVATFDQPMIQQWATQQTAIREQFAAMQRNLPPPYDQAFLPQVQRPEYIIR
jgi:hypothetical protein